MILIALRTHGYGGKTRRPGDRYEVKSKPVAAALVKVGQSRYPTPEESEKLEVKSEKLATPVPVEPPQKRRYQRRDMRAEE